MLIKRIILTVFVLLIVLNAILTGCTKQKQTGLTIADGLLSIGVEVGYPPMEYYDTDGITLLGFDIELAKALAEKLGMEAVFIDTSWEGIFAGLEAGRYDIAVNITILPERQKKFNFTRPYIDSSMTIVTLKDSPFKIETPKDIAGFRVSYQGYTTAQYFTERLREQGVLFPSFSYDKITNCFDDLKLRRLDIIVVDNIVAFNYAGEDTPFEVVWQGPSGEYIGICLKKGNDALTAALDNALEELFEDGTLLAISQRIFNRDLVTPVRKIN
ncbi:MAG: ABC transporter substrate-binding protein [Treponema sp.]|jgi:polar amino acid transport system substrate-binding protein|nr:ABC transporter substrate-binding protein [Treponema sp.]